MPPYRHRLRGQATGVRPAGTTRQCPTCRRHIGGPRVAAYAIASHRPHIESSTPLTEGHWAPSQTQQERHRGDTGSVLSRNEFVVEAVVLVGLIDDPLQFFWELTSLGQLVWIERLLWHFLLRLRRLWLRRRSARLFLVFTPPHHPCYISLIESATGWKSRGEAIASGREIAAALTYCPAAGQVTALQKIVSAYKRRMHGRPKASEACLRLELVRKRRICPDSFISKHNVCQFINTNCLAKPRRAACTPVSQL